MDAAWQEIEFLARGGKQPTNDKYDPPPTFAGIEASGDRICYVIDLSDSMLEPLSPREMEKLPKGPVTGPSRQRKEAKNDAWKRAFENVKWDKVTNKFLSIIDGESPLSRVFTVLTTNRLDILDPALIRSKRLKVLNVTGHMRDEDALRIMRKELHHIPLEEGLTFEEMVRVARVLCETPADFTAFAEKVRSLRVTEVEVLAKLMEAGQPRPGARPLAARWPGAWPQPQPMRARWPLVLVPTWPQALAA